MEEKLASGDNNNKEADIDKTINMINNVDDEPIEKNELSKNSTQFAKESNPLEATKEKEMKLKERIGNCKKIIETLKLELTEEKAKLLEKPKSPDNDVPDSTSCHNFGLSTGNIATANKFPFDSFESNKTYFCSASIDNKLRCDKNLMEYEKQLQKYQHTLNMAQAEKKNAIRKEMLAKAFRLKLLEVENQCNIELLRVKQSLQCLEPLQMIVKKWKTNDEESSYNLNSYELIPKYPEVNPTSTSSVNIFTDDEKRELIAPDEDV